MSLKRICPFFLIFFKTENINCIMSECELWSEKSCMCSISLVQHRLLSLSDSINRLIELYDLHNR